MQPVAPPTPTSYHIAHIPPTPTLPLACGGLFVFSSCLYRKCPHSNEVFNLFSLHYLWTPRCRSILGYLPKSESRLHSKKKNRELGSSGAKWSSVHSGEKKKRNKVIDSSFCHKELWKICLWHCGYMVILMKVIPNANNMSITYCMQPSFSSKIEK